MEHVVSIPDERIGRVVGKNGEVKKSIEKQGRVKLKIEDGTVTITGESLDILNAKDVVKAIGLGFTKDYAFELFNDNLQLIVFDVAEAIPEAHMSRLMGRIIGEHGKVKTHIEIKLQTKILVTDTEVAGIGSPSRLQVLREVLERLLGGATHANVYKHIDRRLASLDKI
ncbi:MAG: RNA-processing protein [Candidatus Altiarchaeota archaeon]|nr:RNA-processing protein [Candidatus Altiarchaeota archaeon]